jgi:hypothetical protein
MADRSLKVLWMGEGFKALSNEEQLSTVQERIRQHYAGTLRYIGFSAILGYTWARTFDSSVEFYTNGTVVNENGDQLLLPEVWLALHPRIHSALGASPPHSNTFWLFLIPPPPVRVPTLIDLRSS